MFETTETRSEFMRLRCTPSERRWAEAEAARREIALSDLLRIALGQLADDTRQGQ